MVSPVAVQDVEEERKVNEVGKTSVMEGLVSGGTLKFEETLYAKRLIKEEPERYQQIFEMNRLKRERWKHNPKWLPKCYTDMFGYD